MKQITTFILLLALCVCTDAAAQRSVRLTVLEKGTEQPVIAANVAYADNPELRNAMHTITDVDGQTVLKLAGKGSWYYKVTYVSFVPETGKIDKTETVKTVYMKDAAGSPAGNSGTEYTESGLRKRNFHAGTGCPARVVPDGRRTYDGRHGGQPGL